jgi:hypothetical protein
MSILAYETNTFCCTERLLVAYCTHILQTKLMQKIYPQKLMFTATGEPTDMPLVVQG